jgi:antitoxin ParD1/3/4
MNIHLPPDLEQFVKERVASGDYSVASEVVRDALERLRDTHELDRAKLDELRREVQTGIDALDRGEGKPAAQVFAELRARLASRLDAAG